MEKLHIHPIVNEITKESLTLYVEWLDYGFSVMLLAPGSYVLCGKMEQQEIEKFSSELDKPPTEYLDESKQALMGQNENVQFYIINDIFEWRYKDILTLGKIQLSPSKSIEALSEMVQKVAIAYTAIYIKLKTLEVENKSLSEVNVGLTTTLDECIKNKIALEEDLYKKFLLILNEKKKKIRDLENLRKDGTNTEIPSIYDATTDEASEEEEEQENDEDDSFKLQYIETEKHKTDTQITLIADASKDEASEEEEKEESDEDDSFKLQYVETEKRKTDTEVETSDKAPSKKKKVESNMEENTSEILPSSPVPSTSKCTSNTKSVDVDTKSTIATADVNNKRNASQRRTRSNRLYNFIEEDSEDDLFE